jgi:hypothetical protein
MHPCTRRSAPLETRLKITSVLTRVHVSICTQAKVNLRSLEVILNYTTLVAIYVHRGGIPPPPLINFGDYTLPSNRPNTHMYDDYISSSILIAFTSKTQICPKTVITDSALPLTNIVQFFFFLYCEGYYMQIIMLDVPYHVPRQ